MSQNSQSEKDLWIGLSQSPAYGDIPATGPDQSQRTEADATGRGAKPLVENVTENEKLRRAFESLHGKFEDMTSRAEVAEAQIARLKQEVAGLNLEKCGLERGIIAQGAAHDALRTQIATLRSRAEDAEATALAWNARADVLVVREKRARWIIEHAAISDYTNTSESDQWRGFRVAWLKDRKEAERG